MNRFLNAQNIAVTSHINPDCDAIGSMLGVYHTLKQAGCNVYAVNKSIPPSELSFLPHFEDISLDLKPNTDIIIALDCGNLKRLGVECGNAFIINIDHHKSNDLYGDENFIDASAVSASCVAFEYFTRLGFIINAHAACCFYAALLSDSGYFCFENVNSKTFSIAMQLCELGANAGAIGKALSGNASLSKLKLEAAVFDKMKVYNDAVFIYVSHNDFVQVNAGKYDSEGFAEKARAIRGIELGVCMRETQEGSVRVSLRSKNSIDVAKVAEMFGGGGHVRAAGFEVAMGSDFMQKCETLTQMILGANDA